MPNRRPRQKRSVVQFDDMNRGSNYGILVKDDDGDRFEFDIYFQEFRLEPLGTEIPREEKYYVMHGSWVNNGQEEPISLLTADICGVREM